MVAAAAWAMVLTGCGAGEESTNPAGAAPVASAPAPGGSGAHQEAMRVDVYERMEDLSAESQVVLVGTVRDIGRGDLNGRPTNHVRVAVERTARGSVPEEVSVVELPNMGPDFRHRSRSGGRICCTSSTPR